MTMTALKKEVQLILGNFKKLNNDTLGVVTDPKSITTLLDVFSTHPSFDFWDEVHGGIKSLEVVRQMGKPPYSASYNDFNIIMNDGYIKTHASYNAALSCRNEKSDFSKRLILQCARDSIFKKHGVGKNGLHLDHSGEYPFIRIITEYIESFGKDIIYNDTISIEGGGNEFTEFRHNHFIDYHDSFAILKLIPSNENLTKAHLAKGYKNV